MAESAKVRRFRERNERELLILIAMAIYTNQCQSCGDSEGYDVEMGNFADRILKLIEKESRRRTPASVATAAENVTVMVSKKA